MKKWLKVLLWIVGALAIAALGVVIFVVKSPADYDLPYEDVSVTTPDGVDLDGWYIPSSNGAVVMVQYGFLGSRQANLLKASILHQHGYGVLLTTTGCHSGHEGDRMTDLETWHQYLLARDDVVPDRIGMLGESLGGAISLMYAAEHQEIRAVVSASSFASVQDAIDRCNFLPHGICVLIAPPLLSREAECAAMDFADVAPPDWIKAISPRPVFILHGGNDDVAGPAAGQQLYNAAGEPKELWFEPDCGHGDFEKCVPLEFEVRLISFFDQYLLGPALPGA